MNHRTFPRTTLATALLLACTCAAAQQGNTAPAAVNVAAPKTTTDSRINLYRISALHNTTGLELRQREVPQSVTVIDQDELKARGIHDMAGALKTGGVNVVRDEGGHYRYQTRGFNIDQIEEDGLSTSLHGAYGNPYHNSQSPSDLAIYERIEVVRGATGLTQANAEPGGTISAVRKKPTAERRIGGDISVDRYGKVYGTVDASGALDPEKTLRARVISVVSKDKTFKDDVDGSHYLVYGVAEKDAGATTTITLGGMVQNSHSHPDPYGLPRANVAFPRDKSLGFKWNKDDYNKANVFAGTETRFNDDWKLNTKVSYTRNDSMSAFGALANENPGYSGLIRGATLPLNDLNRYDNAGRQAAAQITLNGKYRLFGREHDVFTGYTFGQEASNTRWKRIRNNTAYDPYTFQGNEIQYPGWGDYIDRTYYGSKQKTHAFNLGSRVNVLDNLHILGGARYTHWSGREFTDYNWWNDQPDNTADRNDKQSRSRVTPYLGITYDINANNSLYTHYSSIFKPQYYRDNKGNFLSPVTGNSYEVGWKGEWLDGKLNTNIALYQIEQKNRPVQLALASGQEYAAAHGKVRSRGLDAEATGNITDAWKINAGYTYNSSKYQKNENARDLKGGNASKHTPKHQMRLYTSYRLPGAAEKWTIGGGMNYQSSTSSLWGVEQKGYALFNADVQYKINDQFNVGLALENITNKRYFENHPTRMNGANNYLGEPRNIMLNFRWEL